MFKNFNLDFLKSLKDFKAAFMQHSQGVTMTSVLKYPAMHKFYNVNLVSTDQQNQAVTTAIEAVNYPFYGI